MNNINIKEMRDLYLQDLSKLVEYAPMRVRARVRNPQKWTKIKSKSVDGRFKDLSEHDPEKLWLWSDLHFGHKNIIGFSDRPFVGINHMNQCLVEYYNDYVQDDDVCIWGGDISFLNSMRTNQLLDLCRGYKILIVGNHDFERKNLKQMNFDEQHLLYHLQHDDMSFVLTHYPMENLPWPHFNIHGHIHVGGQWDWEKYGEQMYNINCEFHGYKPITFAQIAEQCAMRKWATRPTGNLTK